MLFYTTIGERRKAASVRPTSSARNELPHNTYAAHKIASRARISPAHAAVVIELAGIGKGDASDG